MGGVLRCAFSVFGYPMPYRSHVTSASQSTDALPFPKWRRPWISAGLHAMPVLIVFFWLLVIRHQEVRATASEVIAVAITSTWCVVGPVLIWFFESHTLLCLARGVRKSVVDPDGYRSVRRMLRTRPLKDVFARVLLSAWLPLVGLGVLTTHTYLRRFGVRGLDDPMFWVLFAGIMYVATYAATGMVFAWRSVKLIRIIASSIKTPCLYHHDGSLGFGFLGQFALRTNLMYLSGWLFMPALVVSLSRNADSSAIASHMALVFAYTAIWLVMFVWPVFVVHKRIIELKLKLQDDFARCVTVKAEEARIGGSERSIREFEFLRLLSQDAARVRTWPLSLDAAFRFISSIIFFPLVVNIAAVLWTAGKPHADAAATPQTHNAAPGQALHTQPR
jgi:hypothetical protein